PALRARRWQPRRPASGAGDGGGRRTPATPRSCRGPRWWWCPCRGMYRQAATCRRGHARDRPAGEGPLRGGPPAPGVLLSAHRNWGTVPGWIRPVVESTATAVLTLLAGRQAQKGSPPHTRGALVHLLQLHGHLRITPAYAGSTPPGPWRCQRGS